MEQYFPIKVEKSQTSTTYIYIELLEMVAAFYSLFEL